MIITTVNDIDWTVKYTAAICNNTVNTVQKLIIVRFLINLENITDI